MIVCFLIFVFIVVLSFGDTYKISSTNQVLYMLYVVYYIISLDILLMKISI